MRNATWLKVAKTAILILVLCVMSAPVALAESVKIPEQSEEYKKGRALNDDVKYNEARAYYETGAKKGDPWCMYSLGTYYIYGKGGLQTDDAIALELITKASNLNLPRANYLLGLWHLNGNHVQKNTKKGMDLLAKVSKQNDPETLRLLGRDFLKGRHGVPQDSRKGLELLIRAAELHDSYAFKFLTSVFYDDEIDIPEETQKRIDHLTNLEGTPSLLVLRGFWYLEKENGLPDDKKKGIELLKKAAELNDPETLNSLGLCYLIGGRGLSKDTEKGIEFIRRAAELNYSYALYNLGLFYLNGEYGLEQSNEKGTEYMKRAAELDNSHALYNLGVFHLNGKYGLEQKNVIGLGYMKKATELDNPTALITLGRYYLNGEHELPKDIPTGMKLIERGADLGGPAVLTAVGKKFLYDKSTISPTDWIKNLDEWGLSTIVGSLAGTVVSSFSGVPPWVTIPLATKLAHYAVDMFDDDGDFPRDADRGAAFLKKAAEQNYPPAMLALGKCYENGTGVEKNYQNALSCYKGAKDAGMNDKKLDESIRRVEKRLRK